MALWQDSRRPGAGYAERLERRAHRADDEVALVARHRCPAPCAVDLDDQARGDHLRLEPVAELQGEAERVEAGPEVGRGGRHLDPDRRRSRRHRSDESGGLGRGRHVVVDHVVDDRPDTLERGGDVLEAVAGDRHRDGRRRRTTPPPRPAAAARRSRRPTPARRRSPSREASSRCAARICSSLTASNRPPDSSRAASASFHETRGCRSGSRSPWCPGPGTARRSPAARHPRPGSRGPWAAGWRSRGRRTACSRASTPRCCRRCRPAAGGSRGRRRGSRRSRTPRSSGPRGAPGSPSSPARPGSPRRAAWRGRGSRRSCRGP